MTPLEVLPLASSLSGMTVYIQSTSVTKCAFFVWFLKSRCIQRKAGLSIIIRQNWKHVFFFLFLFFFIPMLECSVLSFCCHFGTLFLWKHKQSQCLGHRGCSTAVTDGDFKPSAQIHTQALALIVLTLPPTNSATQLFSVIPAFIVSQPGLLAI